MGFDSDLRSLVQNLRLNGAPGGGGPGHVTGEATADSSEEMGFQHAAMMDQRRQMRKHQLQTRGLSEAGASQVVAGASPSNAVDAMIVSGAQGKPPAACV
jgi:hypothetical protein